MADDHDHGAPAVRDLTPAFRWAANLNTGFVVVSALIILATGWLVVDPVTAVVVSFLVGWSAFDLFRSAIH